MTPRVNPTKLLVEDCTEIEETTKAGIIMPTAVTKRVTMKGRIIIVGEGTANIPMIHRVGDTALYHPKAGVSLTWNDKEYRLIDVSDVFLSGV